MDSGLKDRQKQRAAKAAAAYIRDGMTIGIGTGSTVCYLIQELGILQAANRKFRAVVTSKESKRVASACGIAVCAPIEAERIHLAIDGVDEIDCSFCAVKGGGGALLREKIVAYQAEEVIYIMDEGKLVKHLGMFPLPVEVLPFSWSWAAEHIKVHGGNAKLRKRNGQIFCTDNGNYILDVRFAPVVDYRMASAAIIQIPGVLETGFFDSVCSRIVAGTDNGVKEIINPTPKALNMGKKV